MTKTILLIDNSLANQLAIKSTFINKYKVCSKNTINDALIDLNGQNIDLIIINTNVDNTNEILNKHLAIPKIVISKFPIAQKDIIKYQINANIIEPYTTIDICNLIDSILQIKPEITYKTISSINPNLLNYGYLELISTDDTFKIYYLNKIGSKILQLDNIIGEDFFTIFNIDHQYYHFLIDLLNKQLYYHHNFTFNNRLYHCIFNYHDNNIAISFFQIDKQEQSYFNELLTINNIITFEYDIINNRFNSNNDSLTFNINTDSILSINFNNDLIHPSDLNSLKNCFNNAFNEYLDQININIHLKLNNEEYQYKQLSCLIKYNSIKQPTKIIGLFQDIDDLNIIKTINEEQAYIEFNKINNQFNIINVSNNYLNLLKINIHNINEQFNLQYKTHQKEFDNLINNPNSSIIYQYNINNQEYIWLYATCHYIKNSDIYHMIISDITTHIENLDFIN